MGLCFAARWSDTDSVAKQTVYGSRGDVPKISPLASLGRNDTGGIAADCGALVLPLASKGKLRALLKDLYSDIVDISIEIPRQARDDINTVTIIIRAREIAIFRSAPPFGNTLPVAGKVKPHDFYNGVP